jgi:hypothetical protein
MAYLYPTEIEHVGNRDVIELSFLSFVSYRSTLLLVEVYHCNKTHDLVCAEVENAFSSYIDCCSYVREAEGQV